MFDVKEIDRQYIRQLFRMNLIPQLKTTIDSEDKDVLAGIDTFDIHDRISYKLAVLGIDIYRYSQYEPLAQSIIPILFDEIYYKTIDLIEQNTTYLFQKMNRPDYKNLFVNTGDGGFQVFETPIHSIIFCMVFESVVRMYNSNHFLPAVRNYVGEISLRYAITYDALYKYENNYYGPAIIKNARILARDKLNRLIIDDNSFSWFTQEICGVENLQTISLLDLSKLDSFRDYDKTKLTVEKNEFINLNTNLNKEDGIKKVDIQKLQEMTEKEAKLNVYNIHIQVVLQLSVLFQSDILLFTYSVGNLNTQGLL
jgi:hypothetical protein